MALGWRDQYLRYREFYLNIQALYKQRADLRAFLEIILSIGTVIIFLVFALKPTALTIISLYGQIQEKQKTSAALSQKISALETARGVFTQNQNFIPDINTAVSNSPQPDVIVQQVLGAAAKDSVNVIGISVGEVLLVGSAPVAKTTLDFKPLPDNAREMPVSISASGSYPNLASFIKDVGNLRTIISLDTVSISSSQTDQVKITVTAISGRVPYLGK